MNKFHINDEGHIKPCSATVKDCAFVNRQHFDNKEDAQNEADRLYNEQYGIINSLSKNDQRIKLSSKMSYSLRHHPEEFSFTMNEHAQVELNDFAEALNIPLSVILYVVEKDEKNRFVVRNNHIWSAQGHSFQANVEYPIVENLPEALFHGTKAAYLDSILQKGLLKNGRQFVHLSLDKDTAKMVASRRSGKSVLLTIDTNALKKQGISVRLSENGVYLSDDIPVSCFSVDTF